MPRPTKHIESPLARIRAFLGLRQEDLAYMLGVSVAQVSHLEAERRDLTPDLAERLAPFRAALPPAAEETARRRAEAEAWGTLPPPPPGPAAAEPLEQRRAACLHEARRLGWALRELPAQAALAARRAAAVPALLAALPPPPPPGAPAATLEEVRLRYIHDWLATVPPALPPDELTRWHLGYARMRALEEEAAALTAVLGSGAAAGRGAG